MTSLSPFHITVPRTARCYAIGAPTAAVRDLWIVCHGYSQLAASFLASFAELSHQTRWIIGPEALSRFYTEPGVHDASSVVGATWMTREDREAEIGDIVTYLDHVYDYALAQLSAQGVFREQIRLHALGFSQGGAAVSRWAARGVAPIDDLVLWGSGIPSDADIAAVQQRRPSLEVRFVYGSHDRHAPQGAVSAQAEALRSAGGRCQVHEFQGGHVIDVGALHTIIKTPNG